MPCLVHIIIELITPFLLFEGDISIHFILFTKYFYLHSKF
jgi:hypothetical protein